MEKFSFGIITPSYIRDFERCKLLSESIDKFSLSPIKHYIIVDRQDFKLFQQLQSSNRKIITVESLLPWWIKKVSILKNGWFSFKTIPLRNWIIQQIVKLAIAEYISEDVLVFVDSDVTFVQPFELQNFVRDNQVRLFREPKAIATPLEPLAKWCDVSHELLNLPAVNYPTANYLGNIITWKRENVLQLHRYLEQVWSKSWIETIVGSWHLSEYMLYGIFVDLVLQERSQHYYDPQKICHNYWEPVDLSDENLAQFFMDLPKDSLAVMISSKADIPVERYVKFTKVRQLKLELHHLKSSDWRFAPES